MSLNAKKLPSSGATRKQFPPMEPGTYPARLVQVATFGVQEQRAFKGEAKPPKLEIMLGYEFLDEFLKDEEGNDMEDKPRWLSEIIPFNPLSSERANSTKRYLALDPDDKSDGDWGKLLGTPCMVTVTVDEYQKDGQTRYKENIASVSSMRPKEAAKAPDLVNEPRVFDFYEPDLEIFSAYPDWIKEKIRSALDFQGSKLQEALGEKKELKEVLNDEVPFDGEEEKSDDW